MNDLNLIVTTEEINMPLDEQDPSLNLYGEFLRSRATKQALDQGKARGLINSTNILDFKQQEFERLRLATERRADIQNSQQQQIKKDQKSNKFANENTGSVKKRIQAIEVDNSQCELQAQVPADPDVVEYCTIIEGKNGKERQTEKSQIVSVQSTIRSLTVRADNDLQQLKEIFADKKNLSKEEIEKIQALSFNYLANETSASSKKEYLKKFTSPVIENPAQESSLSQQTEPLFENKSTDQAPPLPPKGIKPPTTKINEEQKNQQDASSVGKSTGAIKKCAQTTNFSQPDKTDRKKILSIWGTNVYLTSNKSHLSSSNINQKSKNENNTDAQEVKKINSSQTTQEKLNAELARKEKLAREKERELSQQKQLSRQQLFQPKSPQKKNVQDKKTILKVPK